MHLSREMLSQYICEFNVHRNITNVAQLLYHVIHRIFWTLETSMKSGVFLY